jgi:hypothetical protein
VKAIDADLDVVWLDYEGKWAIIQKLYNTPSFDELLDRTARELQKTLREQGTVWTLDRCAAASYITVWEDCIVFRVEDPVSGDPWPLDDRTFTRLRELAWVRRNLSLRDHLEASRQRRSEAEASRERRIAGIWDSIKRDKVFARQLSDALWQIRPTRSVGGAPIPDEEPPPSSANPAPPPDPSSEPVAAEA